MKKFISLLLALVLVAGVLPTTAFAADDTQNHENHCVCGGLGNVGDHVCDETNPTWQPWTGTETNGYYYLESDMTLNKA